MAAPIDVRVLENEKQVAESVSAIVLEKAEAAINEKNVFTVGVSGGSMAKFFCQGLKSADTDWSKWRIFFCDERHVPRDHPESTYKYYQENLFSNLMMKEDNLVYKIKTDVTVEESAADYLGQLRSVFPGNDLPRFDVLLLGMGPDGHTCSLFPGHPLLQATSLIAPISDSPKPPSCRVTMTLPLINNSRLAIFAACGDGKAAIVKNVLEGGPEDPLPAAMVRPTHGAVLWFLDKSAASKLQKC